ncbi:MAG: 2-phospho-L-lactate/phosphoenolpyruvate guanylyltransferase [Actinomycetota bacterium]|jgi:2-phospho-L-lactate guanylyltransferase|nr:2-phospho-L-lactate/phosphoenolpyruvate guanylyltransferase [Actinomycetota bacterium]
MTRSAQRWCLVVPVKRLAAAKTRLAGLAGPRREDLALAFALDTTEALVRCPLVAEVLVVTDEPVAASELGRLGAHVVADEPDAGLNPALVHGARVAQLRHPGVGVGVGAVSADLPALNDDEVADVLAAAPTGSPGFVPDRSGRGTTMLLARDPRQFVPAFGAGSAARHRGAGAVALAAGATVRRDVDTEADLLAAVALGLGPRTRAALAMIAPGRFVAAG